jgi:hypothetical protein
MALKRNARTVETLMPNINRAAFTDAVEAGGEEGKVSVSVMIIVVELSIIIDLNFKK